MKYEVRNIAGGTTTTTSLDKALQIASSWGENAKIYSTTTGRLLYAWEGNFDDNGYPIFVKK